MYYMGVGFYKVVFVKKVNVQFDSYYSYLS
jgi:hypothetical protein